LIIASHNQRQGFGKTSLLKGSIIEGALFSPHTWRQEQFGCSKKGNHKKGDYGKNRSSAGIGGGSHHNLYKNSFVRGC
jgi:hypothetical protein